MILNASAAMSRQRRSPALGPVSPLLVGGSRRWCWLSGRERDLPQAGECFGEGQGPGPVLSQAQEDFALSAGDAGGGVQQPIPQRFGFGPLRLSSVK